MGFLEVGMVALGLSMDAFAVALCKGLCMKKPDFRYTAIIAAFFGGFQAVMPLVGWLLGRQFERYITNFDHWIAFILLSFSGAKMLKEAMTGDDECNDGENQFRIKEIFVLAIATSIDALATGIAFAFLSVSILPSIALIGCITFSISAFGVSMGNRFGAKLKSKAEIAGGLVLILIGTRILLNHLGIL